MLNEVDVSKVGLSYRLDALEKRVERLEAVVRVLAAGLTSEPSLQIDYEAIARPPATQGDSHGT